VADLGNAGPDEGKGGKFLFLPPNYEGPRPEGFFTYQSDTYGNFLLWRGFLREGDPKHAVQSMKEHIHVYPLARGDYAAEQSFINLSGREFHTIHANDYRFFEEVHGVIQYEPSGALDSETLGLLLSIGIEKGRPFLPNAAAKRLLEDAVAVGNATARALVFAPRDRKAFIYEDMSWMTAFIGGSHDFSVNNIRLLDARATFFYYATMVTPAMAANMTGVGSQYAVAMRDKGGKHLHGGKTYRLTLPPDVPAGDFWSLVVYDNQSRSMLQTDQLRPGLNSLGDVQQNADGSTDIFFGPRPPAGMESNWIQTIPGKGWTTILRIYGPQKSWFDKSWKPGHIELIEEIHTVDTKAVRPAMATDIPEWITTPDSVETRIGILEFIDGVPTNETVHLLYDNLDFIRGVEAFLSAIPGASLVAMRQGFRDVGIRQNGIVMITEELLDSRSLYLTANTESVYAGTWLDLKRGPMVVESPPNTRGMLNDFFFRYVADLGNAGPDRGRGGRYLFLPPDYEGDVPEGYFVYRSRTYGNLLFWRSFLQNGDAKPTVEAFKRSIRIYPLSQTPDLNSTVFINISGAQHSTIHSNDLHFYEEIETLLQEEPAVAFSPEILGLLSAIGIRKGKPFAPDARMKHILVDAVDVGNATARAISFHQSESGWAGEAFLYEDSAWFTPFIGGSYDFSRNGARLLDARTMYHYCATGITPAMAMSMVGDGSQFALACMDAGGRYLDGTRSYRLHLPTDVPAQDSWSVVVYDPQTRSMLQTDQRFPSLNSERSGVQANSDGSFDIYFSPDAPAGKQNNWIQTVPGKGWFVILRLYGPLEPWFDTSWRPGELELLPNL
jgi:hypothetical protein